jgi:hypothetical protein
MTAVQGVAVVKIRFVRVPIQLAAREAEIDNFFTFFG